MVTHFVWKDVVVLDYMWTCCVWSHTKSKHCDCVSFTEPRHRECFVSEHVSQVSVVFIYTAIKKSHSFVQLGSPHVNVDRLVLKFVVVSKINFCVQECLAV